VIEEDLVRHFRSVPAPHLSAGFDAGLRRRLEATRRPVRRVAVFSVIRRGATPAYWIAATAVVFETVRPPAFTGAQIVMMAAAVLLSALALQRALRTQLSRILRDALLR
jgi:hypothetical protein